MSRVYREKKKSCAIESCVAVAGWKKNLIVYFNDQKWAYDVEGVEVSRVYREREKKSCAIESCVAAAGWNFFLLYILMTKSGLMTLRELRCHVCIEREKKILCN